MNSRWIWVPYKQTHIQQARMEFWSLKYLEILLPAQIFQQHVTQSLSIYGNTVYDRDWENQSVR